ncbi:MAG: hypothetical protein ACOX6T_24885 [Myxococcales bacterium]|jgi:hypothetical protein
MTLRVTFVIAVLTLCLGACLPTPEETETCAASIAGATAVNLDKSSSSYPDGCVEIDLLRRTGFDIELGSSGPVSSLKVSGRTLEKLDLNTVGEYECDSYLDNLKIIGIPTDPDNPAYGQGAYSTSNQNTAVEGDCLYGSCKVSVTSPATSGTLKLHLTAHLSRLKAGEVPPFRCDYIDVSFDLSVDVEEPLE